MKPKKNQTDQGELFSVELLDFIDPRHKLIELSKKIDWERFEVKFDSYYSPSTGSPGVPTRLLVGLTYLKYVSNKSDEEVLKEWVENPYWQFFCGERYFQKSVPCDRSTLSRWRKRIGEKGAEELFDESLSVAFSQGCLKLSHFKELYVDTTVQEKNIAYPSEANLLNRARAKLVMACEGIGLRLRQKYTRVGKLLQIKAHRHAQANQWNRMRRVIKKLRNILGRILREIQRANLNEDPAFESILLLAKKLYHSPETKEKVYSLHEPHVEAIAKGKIHKKFEFGNKVSIVRTRKGGFVVDCAGLHENPYDGHTLENALKGMESRLGKEITAKVGVDLGYRGHGISKKSRHKVYHPKLKKLPRSIKLFVRARSSVEATISHMKRCFRLGRNYLAGKVGDVMNAFLSAAALNLSKVMQYT
jgi:transposase, IS5 family